MADETEASPPGEAESSEAEASEAESSETEASEDAPREGPEARLLAREPVSAVHPLDDPARDAPHWTVHRTPEHAVSVDAPIYDAARNAAERERVDAARAAPPPAREVPRPLYAPLDQPLTPAERTPVRVTVVDDDSD